MAVDASVLIYERLREEIASGKSLRAALPAAYDKAFSSIFDANVTTLITATILFFNASGPVKGFAIVARARHPGLALYRADCRTQRPRMAGRQRPPQEDLDASPDHEPAHRFSRQRLPRRHVLARLILAGATAFYIRGEKNFGVDFRGGDLVTLSAPHKVDVGQVRGALATDRSGRCLDPAVHAGRQKLHHDPRPLNTSDKIEKSDPAEPARMSDLRWRAPNGSERWSAVNWPAAH